VIATVVAKYAITCLYRQRRFWSAKRRGNRPATLDAGDAGREYWNL